MSNDIDLQLNMARMQNRDQAVKLSVGLLHLLQVFITELQQNCGWSILYVHCEFILNASWKVKRQRKSANI